jgi:hypothetical protein
MHRIIEVKPAPGYVLEVEFSDGVSGKVDLSDRLFGPMFEPLLDSNVFNQVQIDEYGAIYWPNGADLAPDALYQKIKREEETLTGKDKFVVGAQGLEPRTPSV